LHLVVCDELAFYLSLPDRKQRQEFAELLRDLVARGRAAGVIVVAATQKPGADVVPTSLRDLFGFRLALRCNTPQASDTILGQGWATAGADASTIPGGQRGVGYLLAEGEQPQRIKGYHLTDGEIAAIAERAAARRADVWLTAATAAAGGEGQP
jgi:DNA segregation ATPase FtsK/SpoIIIE-like protein